MIKKERQERILELLNRKEFVSVSEISEELFISPSSVRRDLSELERKHILKRSYGGARLITAKSNVVSFGARSYDYVEAKQTIAAKAARLVREGNVVFLDQSSTCYFLAMELARFQNLTVVTNNLEILSLLSRTELTVIATGGVVSRENRSCLVGGGAQRGFSEINADILFFSANAITEEGVITDCTQEEIFLRHAMLDHAARKVFLCDSSKLGKQAPYVQCDLNRVNVLICESDRLAPLKARFPRLQIL